MANMQTSAGRFRRIFGWFRRHKVTAVFTVLLVALLLWLLESWIVWNVQVHFERERYTSVDHMLIELDSLAHKTNPSTTEHHHSCTYTDDGSIFAVKHLGCETEVDVIYQDITRQDALTKLQEVKALVVKRAGRVVKSQNPYESGDLGLYDFKSNQMDCIYDGLYYDQTVPSYQRPVNIHNENNIEYIEINCGGQAKAEYFPVTKD